MPPQRQPSKPLACRSIRCRYLAIEYHGRRSLRQHPPEERTEGKKVARGDTQKSQLFRCTRQQYPGRILCWVMYRAPYLATPSIPAVQNPTHVYSGKKGRLCTQTRQRERQTRQRQRDRQRGRPGRGKGRRHVNVARQHQTTTSHEIVTARRAVPCHAITEPLNCSDMIQSYLRRCTHVPLESCTYFVNQNCTTK